jgi:glutamyl endopeptidase
MATKSKPRKKRVESEAYEHFEESSEGLETVIPEDDANWESEEASLDEPGMLTEAEESEEDHEIATSDQTGASEADLDVEQPGAGEPVDDGVGDDGNESAALEMGAEVESVPGFDESVLALTRGEAVGEDAALDAYYADLGDPTAAAMLLQQPRINESVQEVVIGRDDRIRVRNTTAYPWRCICSLRIRARDGSNWIGTGWMISPRTVVTAGHCLYIHSRGGWVSRIEVIPGRNGGSRPFGSCTSSTLRSVRGWTRSKKRSHDYGAIIMPRNCSFAGRLGWFGFANQSTLSLLGRTVNLSGYPGDKPAGTQWWHARGIRFATSRRLIYNIDTAGGQSGSPVWRLRNGKRYAVGIHTNGSPLGNSATRISRPVFRNLKAWKSQGM